MDEGIRRIVRDFDQEEAVEMLIDHEFCVSKAEAKRVYVQVRGRSETKKITRYDIDADINDNGEAYHFRDRNNYAGEYVLYSDFETYVAELETQLEARKCCSNCGTSNKHGYCPVILRCKYSYFKGTENNWQRKGGE